MPSRSKAVAFETIGTTFSLGPIRQRLIALGFPQSALDLWFSISLRDAFALAASESFQPFKLLLQSALEQLSNQFSVAISAEQKQLLLSAMSELPAHDDAGAAFEALKSASVGIIAISNGAAATTKALLERAKLMSFVDHVESVDEVRASKPRKDVYLHAARTAAVDTRELALVATHAWDVHGAKAAGLMAGFVARGQTFPKIMNAPDVIGESLSEVARQFAALDEAGAST